MDLTSILKSFAPATGSVATTAANAVGAATGINQTVANANKVISELDGPAIQQDINTAKDIAVGYVGAQLFLQVISTGAMCVMAYIAYQEWIKKRG